MRFITYALIVSFFCSGNLLAQNFIADHRVAKESVLRSIPVEYIALAREKYKVAYQHTSHGTHVAYGMYGLPQYKDGDDTLFAISNGGESESGKLHFMDCYSAPSNRRLANYSESGVDASDLSRNETAFIQATRNFLDASTNQDVNVIMWSWCSIRNHDVSGNYLPGMDSLISEYGEGGTEPRAATNPVTFIFFTGHAESGNNIGDGKPANQAKLITDHCIANNYYCLDYYGIDAHGMDDSYYDDASDNGTSSQYGGSFYGDWQNSHNLGEDWYENRTTPGGSVGCGSHVTQHITSNRKAYAMWWILARMAGWRGETSIESDYNSFTKSNRSFVNNISLRGNKLNVYLNNVSDVNGSIINLSGQKIASFSGTGESYLTLSTEKLSAGTYLLKLRVDGQNNFISKFIITQ